MIGTALGWGPGTAAAEKEKDSKTHEVTMANTQG